MYINDSIADSKIVIFTDSYNYWKENIAKIQILMI